MTSLAAGAAPVLKVGPTELYIDGRFRPSHTGRRFEVLDPATSEVLTTVADADEVDARQALDAAVSASTSWATTPPRQRGEVLRRAFDLLMLHRDRFAITMSAEMGKPLDQAHGEITYGGEFLRWFAEEAPRVAGRIADNPEATGTMVVRRRPVGPCLLVTPWNFPLAMATRKIAPALAAGCTVVVKPAEQTPLTTLLFAELLAEAGVPDGVVNVVTTTKSPEVVGMLLDDRRLRKLSFTGSTRVGRELIARAGGNVLRTSMELGGNAPFLVFDDADLDAAVEGAMLAKFRNMGQACTAANRFLVHRSVSAEFADRVVERVSRLRVGPGLEPDTDIGALITRRAVVDVERLVADAVRRGARVRIGGNALPGSGSFFEPTVLTGVPADSAVCREEIFGPVLPIMEFDSEQEALRLANDTEYGLVAYAYTQNMKRIGRIMSGLETGMLGINSGVVSNAAAPFGGVKQSGTGREGGVEGIDEYLSTTYTLVGQ